MKAHLHLLNLVGVSPLLSLSSSVYDIKGTGDVFTLIRELGDNSGDSIVATQEMDTDQSTPLSVGRR